MVKTTYKYEFNINDYDVEAMMDSGLVIDFEYKEYGDKTFMAITTSRCVDYWFA